jgi:hypothetical protein
MGLLALGFFDALHSVDAGERIAQGLYGVLAALAMAVGVLIWLQTDYRKSSKILLTLALLLFLFFAGPKLYFIDGLFALSIFEYGLAAPIVSMSVLFLFAIVSGRQGWRKSFSLATLMIGVRFLVLYFQAMGGLAATGLGLLISGLLIMGIVWVWHKSRGFLMAQMGMAE